MAFYPINLNISNRRCLVVGGGSVAARKIESLLVSDAAIRVVSPEVCGKISDMADSGLIEWTQRTYQERDLDGVFLVFAATNQPTVQELIASQAKQAGVLLNSVDSPDQCDFHVPAKIRRGDLLIAVSTGGSSPALSARIKHRLYRDFGPEYETLVELLAQIRGQVVGGRRESDENRQLFQQLLELPLLDLIGDEKWQEIQCNLELVLPEEINCSALVTKLQKMSTQNCPLKTGDRISTYDQ